jgi:hypothetical protein
MTTLWTDNPLILFKHEFIFEVYPTADMSFERKVNAITRMLVFFTVIGYILTTNTKLLIIGVALIFLTFLIYKTSSSSLKEGFVKENKDNEKKTVNNVVSGEKHSFDDFIKENYQMGTYQNPYGNVSMADYENNPDRMPAPPAFDPTISETITKNVKRAVQRMNPTIENSSKKLYGNLWDQRDFEQSNRQFYTMPSTQIPNDRHALEIALSEGMASRKEANHSGAMKRVANAERHTLY